MKTIQISSLAFFLSLVISCTSRNAIAFSSVADVVRRNVRSMDQSQYGLAAVASIASPERSEARRRREEFS